MAELLCNPRSFLAHKVFAVEQSQLLQQDGPLEKGLKLASARALHNWLLHLGHLHSACLPCLTGV